MMMCTSRAIIVLFFGGPSDQYNGLLVRKAIEGIRGHMQGQLNSLQFSFSKKKCISYVREGPWDEGHRNRSQKNNPKRKREKKKMESHIFGEAPKSSRDKAS